MRKQLFCLIWITALPFQGKSEENIIQYIVSYEYGGPIGVILNPGVKVTPKKAEQIESRLNNISPINHAFVMRSDNGTETYDVWDIYVEPRTIGDILKPDWELDVIGAKIIAVLSDELKDYRFVDQVPLPVTIKYNSWITERRNMIIRFEPDIFSELNSLDPLFGKSLRDEVRFGKLMLPTMDCCLIIYHPKGTLKKNTDQILQNLKATIRGYGKRYNFEKY